MKTKIQAEIERLSKVSRDSEYYLGHIALLKLCLLWAEELEEGLRKEFKTADNWSKDAIDIRIKLAFEEKGE